MKNDTPTRRNTMPKPLPSQQAMAKGLGWFSIGLGLAEVLAPRIMARIVGMSGREHLVRAYGLREIATGVGLLMAKDPRPWLWGRVAGDALDLATLSTDTGRGRSRSPNALIAIAAVGGVTAVDLITARAAQQAEAVEDAPVRDYSDRVGLAEQPEQMRGAARIDFEPPEDMLPPLALRPYPPNLH